MRKIQFLAAMIAALMFGILFYVLSPNATAKDGRPKPTPTPTPTLTTTPAPTDFHIITRQQDLPILRVGGNDTVYIEACCGTGTPYLWKLTAGAVPDGMRFVGNDLKLSRTTAVFGSPTRVQTATFTVQATDQAGNKALATFTLTVQDAAALEFTTGPVLPSGTVGQAYAVGVFASGGQTPYSWTLVGGALPTGLTLQRSPGRIQGTPTTAGTFSFTLRVTDAGGRTATNTYQITINP